MTLQLQGFRIAGNAGLELYVHRFTDDAAAPRGVTVLCLHGFLDGGATWEEVAAPLAAAGFEVLAPDQRGYGASGRVGIGGYYHFPDYVADVDALVRQLAPSRLVVVGHSMGGTVAAQYAGARPERVEKLVLIEGVGPPSMPADQGLYRMRKWLDDLQSPQGPRPMPSLEAATRRLGRNHPQVAQDVLERRARQLTNPVEGGFVWAHDPLHRTTSPSVFSVGVLGAFLRAYAKPVLFVGGGENGFHPVDEAERLREFADVRRIDLPGAGHMVHWTKPGELARELLGFLG